MAEPEKPRRRSFVPADWGPSLTLNRGLSVSFRIAFAIFLILVAVSGCFMFNSYVQHRLVLLISETLDSRVPAILSAQRVKLLLLNHDDVLFRYLATRDEGHLSELESFQRFTRWELRTLNNMTSSDVVRTRLRLLNQESERYFLDASHLLEFSKKTSISKNVGLFGAASLVREQNAQRQELDLLSAEGRSRLVNLFALCNELMTLNRRELERAQSDMHALLSESRQSVFIATVIAGGFTLLIGLWLALSLTGQLKILLKGIERVKGGDFDFEVPLVTQPGDELSQVTNAFNRMIRTIHDQRQRMVDENIHDGMTGLVNHRHFRFLLKQEVARASRTGSPMSLLMIDIDFFKKYNDKQGHEFGNELLKGLARILLENLRDMDTLARYGGDELSVILPQMAAQEAALVGERLMQAAASARFPGDEIFPKGHLTLSVGGASFPEDAVSLVDIIMKADGALYQAKTAGRDALRWHDPASVAGR